MDLYVCDFAICDVGMKIVIWSGIEEREKIGSFSCFFCILIEENLVHNSNIVIFQ